MIGWMQDPKPANLEVNGRRDSGIFGQMTIPRELSLRDGKLIQLPVKELEAYRAEQASHKDVELAQSWTSIPGIGGRVLDMELEIRAEAGCKGAGVRFAADDEHYVELWYDPQRSVIRVDRSQSIPSADIPASRTVRVRDRQGVITLRLLLDRWSAEVFVNDGEQVMSVMYYTDLTAQDILFKSEGSSSMNVSSRTLNVR